MDQQDLNKELLEAAYEGSKYAVSLALDKGADIDAKDNTGYTALHYAAEQNYNVIVKELLERGADINVKNNDGWTPLYLAAHTGSTEVVDDLLRKGAFVDLVTLVNYEEELDVSYYVHKQLQQEDRWSSILLFILREQDKNSKEDFKKLVQTFLKNYKIPQNIRIVLNTLI